MSVEEIKVLLSYVGVLSIGAIIAGVILFLLLKSFVPSYLAQKAQNLATKEDIAHVTSEIERVKSQYAVLLEELKARHQLRLAAVDRRLQAHQEAFALWRKLLSNTYHESIHNVVIECQEWWSNNCLYLSPEAREAFSDAYLAAHMHASLVKSPGESKEVKANWDKIRSAGERILRAVDLPALGVKETEIVPERQSGSKPAINPDARQGPHVG